MSIWRTSIPTNKDFPIWAYIHNQEEDSNVVLISDPNTWKGDIVTWTHAIPPKSSEDLYISEKFQALANKVDTTDWSSLDWFREGYVRGRTDSFNNGPLRSQEQRPAESAFVDPTQYHQGYQI